MNRSDAVLEINELADKGYVADALEQLRELLLIDPNDQLLSYTRVSLLASHFPPKLAIKEIAAYSKRFPSDQGGPALGAWVLLYNNQAAEALKVLSKAEDSIGLNDYGRGLKIEILKALGRFEEAKLLISGLSENSRPETIWAKGTAQQAMTEEQMLESAGRLREAGENFDWVEFYISNWYIRHGQLEKAEETILAALSLHPFHPGLNQYMAGIETRLNRADDALDRMLGVFDRNPSDIRALRWLCSYYLRRFQLRKLLKTVEKFGKAMRRTTLRP